MFVTTAVLCLILLITFLYRFKKTKNKILNFLESLKVPGPPSRNIFVGNCTELYTTPENVFKKIREYSRSYYPIYNLRVLFMVGVCILHPKDFELILSNPKHADKSFIYDMLHPWLGAGLLTSNGKKWLTRRRILTPGFHFSILQQFVTVFNEETESLVETFKSLNNQPFIVIDAHIAQFTLKTIAETAMGTKLKFESNKEINYKQAIYDIGEVMLYRLLHAWFINKFINFFSPKYFQERKSIKILHNFSREVITKREKTLQGKLPSEAHEVYKSKKRMAMLDLLLTAKNEDKIDNEGIREEVDTFMFEGHDTTAVALSFALMLIACNRTVQEQIVEEMSIVLGDVRKKPTYNDLQEMKYLERAVKEVLRLYPSVHFISRKLGEDLVTSSGYKMPKNMTMHLHIYDLHHNPDFYPDPEKFDPDRFLPENSKNRHPFAYLPFSAGPRNCIGQKFAMLELKSTICGILANFILEPVDTPSTIVLVVDFVLRTKDGIKVKFVPRG